MGKMKEISAELEDLAERMNEIEAAFARQYTPEHESLEKEFGRLWRRYNALEKQIG